MAERVFAMVKPDGVQRGLVGEVVRRYEARGLKVVGLKLMQVPKSLAEAHYAEHQGKKFYDGLVKYITSGPVVALVVEGKDAIKVVRTVNGATNPVDAVPGTIRGDYALDIGRNVVHGSDSPESAAREIGLYFTKDELVQYELATKSWVQE
ncbi:MAG TPA: nucleoside-diphosphate kinase [Candidatus Thermoplasmatota archaeon]|nr:nucleoside-diphosphate kinase [Candidatus Thermoplasmatota archaeon]